MRKTFLILLLLLLQQNLVEASNISIVIHGGAGTISRENLSDQQEQSIRTDLQAAVEAGYQVLANGGDSTSIFYYKYIDFTGVNDDPTSANFTNDLTYQEGSGA
ncbi:MAG: isoaspartyl peptidase/L-asparaginase, partial [Proteobacteria bacterium]|nr:isoaspartyl peptidase/L-asparaginase [Pseudomonadota bacterium]